MTDNGNPIGLGEITDSQAELAALRGERFLAWNASASKLWHAEIKARTDAIIERAQKRYGKTRKEAASAKRIANDTFRVITTPPSAPMPTHIEDALEKNEETQKGIMAWVADFYNRKGKPPPFRLIKGGRYEKRRKGDADLATVEA
jgi:ElaB/YqjD/DUF883 family membrane-anchored ribosome-binding protein